MTGRLRALSIYRPYSPLIATGRKRFECRNNWTSHLGDLAIHASKTCMPDNDPIWQLPEAQIGPGGAIIAVVSVVACLPIRDRQVTDIPMLDEISVLPNGGLCMHRWGDVLPINDQIAVGRWKSGTYAYQLDAVRQLTEPVEVRGMPGIWTLSDDITAAVRSRI